MNVYKKINKIITSSYYQTPTDIETICSLMRAQLCLILDGKTSATETELYVVYDNLVNTLPLNFDSAEERRAANVFCGEYYRKVTESHDMGNHFETALLISEYKWCRRLTRLHSLTLSGRQLENLFHIENFSDTWVNTKINSLKPVDTEELADVDSYLDMSDNLMSWLYTDDEFGMFLCNMTLISMLPDSERAEISAKHWIENTRLCPARDLAFNEKLSTAISKVKTEIANVSSSDTRRMHQLTKLENYLTRATESN